MRSSSTDRRPGAEASPGSRGLRVRLVVALLLAACVAAGPALGRTGAVFVDRTSTSWQVRSTGAEDPRWPAPGPTGDPAPSPAGGPATEQPPGPTSAPTVDPGPSTVTALSP